MTLAAAQQRRLLERLREASDEAVAFAELHAAGIAFPAAVVIELELHSLREQTAGGRQNPQPRSQLRNDGGVQLADGADPGALDRHRELAPSLRNGRDPSGRPPSDGAAELIGSGACFPAGEFAERPIGAVYVDGRCEDPVELGQSIGHRASLRAATAACP
jgi:hypothetical protein